MRALAYAVWSNIIIINHEKVPVGVIIFFEGLIIIIAVVDTSIRLRRRYEIYATKKNYWWLEVAVRDYEGNL